MTIFGGEATLDAAQGNDPAFPLPAAVAIKGARVQFRTRAIGSPEAERAFA